MAIATFSCVIPLWGWWDLGRKVTLNPIERAKAFNVPRFRTAGLGCGAKDIVKDVGNLQVGYIQVQLQDATGNVSRSNRFHFPEKIHGNVCPRTPKQPYVPEKRTRYFQFDLAYSSPPTSITPKRPGFEKSEAPSTTELAPGIPSHDR
jgi:hypothetical protein